MPIPRKIVSKVRDFARANALLAPGPLVVAVSGGTDSTALLLLLAELRDELGLVLHVAHFDHRARGAKAGAADAAFVSELADRVAAPVRVGRAERALKTEDAARRARYAFLRRATGEIGARAIVTGHTRDDQAETVLLHLVRGSGLAGLAGMRPSREGIERPILCLTRADTIAVCRAAGIRPLDDATNRSPRYARNRIRHRVLPELAALNPKVVDAIARLADAAAAEADGATARAASLLARASGGGAIDLDALAADPSALPDALELAWRAATGRGLSARHRDALAREASRRDGTSGLDLPGGRAVREYRALRLEPLRGKEAQVTSHSPAADETPLARGTSLEWDGWRFEWGTTAKDADGFAVNVPATHLDTLVVRPRRAGDRLAPPLRTKVQDAFIDAKLPARLRARWPVVAGHDGVWWIPGVGPRRAGKGTVSLLARPPHSVANELWAPNVRK